MHEEPASGVFLNFFQLAGLLEEMRGAGYHR